MIIIITLIFFMCLSSFLLPSLIVAGGSIAYIVNSLKPFTKLSNTIGPIFGEKCESDQDCDENIKDY